jgi:hypothetical protein
MTPHEMAIICRFSRNGVIPWQSIAVMLGRDRGALRAEWEALASTPITMDPPNIGPVDVLPEPACYRSPRPKGPNLRMSIIAALSRCRMSAETLAGLTATGVKPTRARLSQLQADGVVFHDGRMPYAWDLTDFGKEVWRREQASRNTEEKAA